MFYTLHFALHSLHFTLHTSHFALYTLHLTLRTLHSTLYTPHSTLYTFDFTLYTPHSTLYTLRVASSSHNHALPKIQNWLQPRVATSMRFSSLCVSTSAPLPNVWAFGFVGGILFPLKAKTCRAGSLSGAQGQLSIRTRASSPQKSNTHQHQPWFDPFKCKTQPLCCLKRDTKR